MVWCVFLIDLEIWKKQFSTRLLFLYSKWKMMLIHAINVQNLFLVFERHKWTNRRVLMCFSKITQKPIKFQQKKFHLRETKNLSTNADSSTITKKILLIRQNSPKNTFFFARGDFTTFMSKVFKSESTSFHYFPQGLRRSKKFRHWTSGSGGKKTVKLSEKVWRTDKHTNTQTNIQIFWLIERIGTEGYSLKMPGLCIIYS